MIFHVSMLSELCEVLWLDFELRLMDGVEDYWLNSNLQ